MFLIIKYDKIFSKYDDEHQKKTEVKRPLFFLVHSARFERTTFGSASRHSIQLSYECKQFVRCTTAYISWLERRDGI